MVCLIVADELIWNRRPTGPPFVVNVFPPFTPRRKWKHILTLLLDRARACYVVEALIGFSPHHGHRMVPGHPACTTRTHTLAEEICVKKAAVFDFSPLSPGLGHHPGLVWWSINNKWATIIPTVWCKTEAINQPPNIGDRFGKDGGGNPLLCFSLPHTLIHQRANVRGTIVSGGLDFGAVDCNELSEWFMKTAKVG